MKRKNLRITESAENKQTPENQKQANDKEKKEKPVFSQRLSQKRTQAGYTQEKFAEEFVNRFRVKKGKTDEKEPKADEKEPKGFYDSLQKYETGKSLPFKKELFQICELLGNCDVGYLLGLYDESEKGIHDIYMETGLEEDAIRFLHTLSQGTDANCLNTLSLINVLLTTKTGREFLDALVAMWTIVSQIDYQIKEQHWTKETHIERLQSAEKDAKYEILEAQERFQRFVYEGLGARSSLNELSELISYAPEPRTPRVNRKRKKDK